MNTEKQIEQITENVLRNLVNRARQEYKKATSSETEEGIRFRDTNINLSPKGKAFALLVNKVAKELGLKTPIITSALRTAESQANAMFDIWLRQGKENGGTQYIKKLYGEMCKSCSPNSREIAIKLTNFWEKEVTNKTNREEIIQKTKDILAAEEISMHQSGNALDYGTTINDDQTIQKIINKIKEEQYADFELIDERVPDENGVIGKGSGSHWHISVNSITTKGLEYLKSSPFLSEQVRQKFDIPLPTDLEALSDIFKRSGKEFYLVGGSVRDALLGKAPKDFDVTTNATPDEVEQMLAKHPEYKVLELGRAFGIVKIITPEGNDYEIATFRTDIGKGRRPDRVEFATIEKDVNRRDLTMNALFYDIAKGEIVDYVDGIKDIENKIVRTVGNPKERFDEDRLRILRALRFAARFGTELDKEADKAIIEDNSLEGVSGERIRDEFLKGIKSSISPINFYQLIERYDLWKQIFPGLTVNKEYPETKDIPVALALLLQDNNSKDIAKNLNKAKYTGDEVKQSQFLLDFKNLSPETALKLKKLYKISGLKDSSLKNFGESIGIPARIIEAFIKYEPTVSSEEFPELSGKELGIAIANREKEKFEEMFKENKSNLIKLLENLFLEDIDAIDEMAIRQFKTVGDWNRRSSFGDIDRKLLTSPRGVEKIKRQWEKTPFDFDIYLVNDPRVNKSQFREVGLVDMSFVRDNMKLTADEIPDPDGNTITIIYTSNTGAERYMSSGWILAHRLGHALARGRGTPAEKWQEFTNHLRKRVADLLKEVYGIDVYSKLYDFKGNAERDKILKYVAQQLGTMKSARNNKMRNWYEFAYELLAQYLLTGKITFNPLPQSIITGIAGWGRKKTHYSKDEETRKIINEEELASIASEIEADLEIILGSAIGKVFVM